MEAKTAPVYNLSVSADRANIKDVVKAILHTIFFHRVFTALQPATHDILDITLPYITDTEISSTIDKRVNAFIRHLESVGASATQTSQQSTYTIKPSRATLTLNFLERKRKKGWFVAKADEETVWETWNVDIMLTTARSEPELARNRGVMDDQLLQAAMEIVRTVDGRKGHIPPITSTETNPFPWQIVVGGGKGGV